MLQSVSGNHAIRCPSQMVGDLGEMASRLAGNSGSRGCEYVHSESFGGCDLVSFVFRVAQDYLSTISKPGKGQRRPATLPTVTRKVLLLACEVFLSHSAAPGRPVLAWSMAFRPPHEKHTRADVAILGKSYFQVGLCRLTDQHLGLPESRRADDAICSDTRLWVCRDGKARWGSH